MNLLISRTLAVALSGLAAAKMARAEPASYTNLDEPSGRSTYAAGINSAGQIVGLYTDVAGSNHGFIDTAGSYTTLDDPLGASTEALGINDSGQVVGFYNNIYSHGFVYNSGKYTSLDDPAATNGTVAFGVNDSGEVVGNYGDSGGFVHGFLYNGGTYTTLDDPLGLSTYATGINSGGEIVGFYYDASAPAGFPGPGANGFVYNAGAYTTLRDPLGVNGTFAYGINDSGQIVGFYYDATDTAHGFVYQGGAYITLNGPLNGRADVIAHGINSAGDIVGFYGGNGGDYLDGKGDRYSGFLAPAAPEPSTWAMMLVGFAGLGFAANRRTCRQRVKSPGAESST